MKKTFIFIFILMCIYVPLNAQSITPVILPQYIQGNTGTNSNRIPFAYRARLTGLNPNATYRFFNQVVISTDAANSNGAGNCIFVNQTGDFFHTSSPSMSKVDTTCGSFTTNTTGTYEGWFVTEPTGNATRFVPGKYIFMRIMLNNGAGGTSVVTRLTTADSVRVVKLGALSSDSTGTGLRCSSNGKPKNFVFLYDNVEGTGRPISGSFIESDGTANTTANSYSAFYANNVNAINGAFGVVLPNILPNGIRRIEQKSLTNDSLIAFATDEDGIWPSGASTINPSGGTTAIILTSSDVNAFTSVNDKDIIMQEYNLAQNYPNPFNPTTTISFSLPKAGLVKLSIYNILGKEISVPVNEYLGAGMHSIQFNASNLSSGVYFYRLTVGSFSDTRRMLIIK